MSIPIPSGMARGKVTWRIGHDRAGTTLPGASGTVRFEPTARAVSYTDATVLPEPVETPVIGGVMTPVDLQVNDPDIWNWKVQPRVGVTWEPFHVDVPGPVDLATAAVVPGVGPVRAVKGEKGDSGASTISGVTGLEAALSDRPRKIDALYWRGQLEAGADVDRLLTRGWWEWTRPNAASHLGLPPGVTEQGLIEVLTGLSTWTSMQRATEALTGRMWIRLIRNPGAFTWWPWKQITTTDMIPTASSAQTRLSADWLHVGDSLTDDVVLAAGQWGNVLAGLTGRHHEIRGWYNQRTFGIATRMGATMYPVTVTGGVIPATGTVTVTGLREQQLAFGGYSGLMSRKIPVWIAGRHGTLQNPTNAGSMVFTPDPAAAATSAAGTVWVEGDMDAFLGRVVTIWAGTNDRATMTPTAIVGLVRQMAARVPHGRMLVFGLLPDPNGTYTARAKAISDALRAEWPDRFFDPAAVLMADQAAGDAGITFTEIDRANIASGFVPVSFRSDSIHLNAAGAKALAYAVHREAVSRGWAT